MLWDAQRRSKAQLDVLSSIHIPSPFTNGRQELMEVEGPIAALTMETKKLS